MIHSLLKLYSYLLEPGKEYTAAEFATLIQNQAPKSAEKLKKYRLTFQKTRNGVSIDSLD
jgi:hypothetical protein